MTTKEIVPGCTYTGDVVHLHHEGVILCGVNFDEELAHDIYWYHRHGDNSPLWAEELYHPWCSACEELYPIWLLNHEP